jgi:hypothetical protein
MLKGAIEVEPAVAPLGERERGVGVVVSVALRVPDGLRTVGVVEGHGDGERSEPLEVLLVDFADIEVGDHVSTHTTEPELVLPVKHLRAFGVDAATCAEEGEVEIASLDQQLKGAGVLSPLLLIVAPAVYLGPELERFVQKKRRAVDFTRISAGRSKNERLCRG